MPDADSIIADSKPKTNHSVMCAPYLRTTKVALSCQFKAIAPHDIDREPGMKGRCSSWKFCQTVGISRSKTLDDTMENSYLARTGSHGPPS